jgi:hypothetical protein
LRDARWSCTPRCGLIASRARDEPPDPRVAGDQPLVTALLPDPGRVLARAPSCTHRGDGLVCQPHAVNATDRALRVRRSGGGGG